MLRATSRSLVGAVCIVAGVAAGAVFAHAQGLEDAQQIKEEVADTALDASSVSDQIEASAYSETGDEEALQTFRALAGEATLVFQEIHDASAQGEELSETRPLFDRALMLAHQAMRVGQSGEIKIDAALVEEFTARTNELGETYRAKPATAQEEVSAPLD